MKLTGTIHLIHKENVEWIFKYQQDGIQMRVPFMFYSGEYEDGQAIEAYLETVGGVERAKPLFPLPWGAKSTPIELPKEEPKVVTVTGTHSYVGQVLDGLQETAKKEKTIV